MKRFFLGLLTLVAAAAGLVAVSPAPSVAADCPYTGCIATSTNSEARNSVRVGSVVRIKVGVKSGGNSYPVGTVKMTIYRQGRSGVVNTQTKAVSRAEQWVSRTTFDTPKKLKKGTYKIVFRFTPRSGSIYEPSSKPRTLKIR